MPVKVISFKSEVGERRSAGRGHYLQARSFWFVWGDGKWRPLYATKVEWGYTSSSKKWGEGFFEVPVGAILKNVTHEGETYYVATEEGLKELKSPAKKVEELVYGVEKILKVTYTLDTPNGPISWSIYRQWYTTTEPAWVDEEGLQRVLKKLKEAYANDIYKVLYVDVGGNAGKEDFWDVYRFVARNAGLLEYLMYIWLWVDPATCPRLRRASKERVEREVEISRRAVPQQDREKLEPLLQVFKEVVAAVESVSVDKLRESVAKLVDEVARVNEEELSNATLKKEVRFVKSRIKDLELP